MNTALVIVIAVIITFFVTLIICACCAWFWVRTRVDAVFSKLAQTSQEVCRNPPPIVYKHPIRPPQENGIYERELALGLLDADFAVTLSNCKCVLPLPNPPPFTHQKRIEGFDPYNHEKHMFAYIFWNEDSCLFSFTGTHFESEWHDDAQFQLTKPCKLNGYHPGVKVHEGFYQIYLSIRSQLWAWWRNYGHNMKWVYVSGHSLGGALCTLCAYDFADICGPAQMVNYSFASPRVGNVTFAKTFNKRVPHGLRIYNTEDIVVSLPPSAIKKKGVKYIYEHVGFGIPFTMSLCTLSEDHCEAYQFGMPNCIPQRTACST